MSAPYEGTLLLGALLDRLGSVQAQAWLARLDRWLSDDDRDTPFKSTRFDRDQFRATDAPYDRRKQTKNGPHNLDPRTAS
jgi:hypothetical protein